MKKLQITFVFLLLLGANELMAQTEKVDYHSKVIPNFIPIQSKVRRKIEGNEFNVDSLKKSFAKTGYKNLNGQDVPADIAAKEINELEMALNARGYSLKDKEKILVVSVLENRQIVSPQLQTLNSLPNATIVAPNALNK